jgi:hypothetical protein
MCGVRRTAGFPLSFCFGALIMKKMLPSGVEVAVLGTIAVLMATVFATLQQDTAIIFFAFPLLLTGMLMGARRTGKLGSTGPLKAAIAEQPAEQTA